MLTAIREQPEAVKFLERVVEGGLTSPLLLLGQEGVGRRFSVTAAAKQRFSNGQDNFHCLQIERGMHPDLIVISPPLTNRDIGVDIIREVTDTAYSFPSMAPVRYVVIDGADYLSAAAANALLKTLEEPPTTTRFFLLTESLSGVLPTIRSRCGLVRYRPLSEALIVEHLSQHTTDATKALVYARLGNGSVGRATQYLGSGRLALRDQVLGLLEKGLAGDLSSLFSAVDNVNGLQLGIQFLEFLLRDFIMLPIDPTRLTNIDIVDKIDWFRRQLGPTRLNRLVTGYADVQQYFRAPVNLGFHVKTWLANAFAE